MVPAWCKQEENQALCLKHWISVMYHFIFFFLFLKMTLNDAMRSKARLSISGSTGENGHVMAPEFPKAVHAVPYVSPGMRMNVSVTDLSWLIRTFWVPYTMVFLCVYCQSGERHPVSWRLFFQPRILTFVEFILDYNEWLIQNTTPFSTQLQDEAWLTCTANMEVLYSNWSRCTGNTPVSAATVVSSLVHIDLSTLDINCIKMWHVL